MRFEFTIKITKSEDMEMLKIMFEQITKVLDERSKEQLK